MCNCGNPEMGFDCVCEHVEKHPGDIEYSCEHCGLYVASTPRCSKCEEGYDSLVDYLEDLSSIPDFDSDDEDDLLHYEK